MNRALRRALPLLAVLGLGLTFAATTVEQADAARVADIKNTKHNLSANSGNTTRAATEDEICVFCHTPHGASSGVTPLWNRALPNTGAYANGKYSSTSIDADPLEVSATPEGTSKMCLSCHDGTIALGQVNVLNGVASADGTQQEITMQGQASGYKMPAGKGAETGYTRNLGTDMSNDHPISFKYTDNLALKDGELQKPSTSQAGQSPANGKLIDVRSRGYRPTLPLETGGYMQCTTCHDPHIRDNALPPPVTNPITPYYEQTIKFLRLNRFQEGDPSTGFREDIDQICLACHTKDGWAQSAHAISSVANELYDSTAAGLRDFPADIQVYQAGCLNCHDTHTVKGARRLLREGTDAGPNGSGVKGSDGKSAIEETCYQCHSKTGTASGKTLKDQGLAGYTVPDVKSDFEKTFHMPIKATNEEDKHKIGTASNAESGANFMESKAQLAQRHTECTDCHNPHRLRKSRLFDGSGGTDAATHKHGTGHTNIISGALRGSWGIEPVVGTTLKFGLNPTYVEKFGDPGTSSTFAKGDPYVTREYQICIKCHSNYGWNDGPAPQLGVALGSTTGGGLDGNNRPQTNNMTSYTNQAMEFAAPSGDRGEPGGNHRSWHPVFDSTGRGTTTRKASASNWLSPWNTVADIGNQTMYCTDCHGSTTDTNTVAPKTGEIWGPHGSGTQFILKGPWVRATGRGTTDALCFRCHQYNAYAGSDNSRDTAYPSGFNDLGSSTNKSNNLHLYHIATGKISVWRCTLCHVAVPHGWKNKALLVNLNQVGDEDGVSAAVQVRNGTTAGYNNPPYYIGAVLKVRTFRSSGGWNVGDCGSTGSPGNGASGKTWMSSSTENCTNVP